MRRWGMSLTSVTSRPCAEKCLRKSASVMFGGRFFTKRRDDREAATAVSVWLIDMVRRDGWCYLAYMIREKGELVGREKANVRIVNGLWLFEFLLRGPLKNLLSGAPHWCLILSAHRHRHTQTQTAPPSLTPMPIAAASDWRRQPVVFQGWRSASWVAARLVADLTTDP